MVPSPAANAAVASAASQWVVFACGAHWFGLPLDRTREIHTPRHVTRLPGCGPQVCGLVGLRGRVITVFDLGYLLGGTPSLGKLDHRLLVLVVKGKRVGAVVDEIIAVAREHSDVLPLGSEVLKPYDIDRDDLLGIGALGDHPFLALDPERILGRLLT